MDLNILITIAGIAGLLLSNSHQHVQVPHVYKFEWLFSVARSKFGMKYAITNIVLDDSRGLKCIQYNSWRIFSFLICNLIQFGS